MPRSVPRGAALLHVAAVAACAAAARAAAGCTADEDCLSASLRCLPDPAGTPCVLDYGYNDTGTCSCQPQQCFNATYANATRGRRQLLVVGDSISLGYTKYAAAALGDAWEVTHAGYGNYNCDNAYMGARCIRAWLGADPSRWDAVSYNAGLHDLAFPDNEHLAVPSYSRFVSAVIAALVEAVRPDARVLWVTTTPVPTDPKPACALIPGRLEADVLAYNAAAAAAVAATAGRVGVCDVHKVITDYCGVGFSDTCNITQCRGPHFVGAGFPMLGAKIAECVAQAPAGAVARAAARAATLAPCTDAPAQDITINRPMGVFSTSGLCLRAANGGAGALSFDACEGAGPVHALETTFALPAAGGALSWNGSLCAGAAAGGAVTLAPCGAAPPSWTAATPAGGHVVDAASGLCLAATAPPLQLLASVFGDGMVLQRGAPAALWGSAAPGAVVDVEFAGALYSSAPASADGRWTVSLPATPAGGPYNISATARGAGGAALTLVDVHFGDVYWCSGQSNLDSANTPVRYAFNATAEVAAAAGFPWVRLFKVAHDASAAPLADLAAPPALAWTPAAPAPVATFSATCWFTGRDIAAALGPAVPIGLIESAWGGTSIQPWSAPGLADACGNESSYPGGWPTAPSVLWNAMTLPFAGMRMAGMVWYQGESNALTEAPEADFYVCALPRLVGSLRALFVSPALHAAVVQLAPWASSASGWNGRVAALRDAQLRAGDAAPNISVVTAVDGGDPFGPIGSIHPRAKQIVGRRAAGATLTAVYGLATPFAGPRFASAARGGGAGLSATVSFTGGGGGLALIAPQATGPFSNSSVCPVGVSASLCAGFEIAGSDGEWRAATGALTADGARLVLSAPAPAGVVATAVASGWSLWPISLLYGANGQVAYPFNATVAAARVNF